MKKTPKPEYLEKAMQLSQEEAEHTFARMRGKLSRRLEDRDIDPVAAVALQIEHEDEQLAEWRQRWEEIGERERKKGEKKK